MSAQMKCQKIIILFDLIAAAVFFVLGLGFSTDLYNLFKFIDPSSFCYVEGSRIYYDVQDFNHMEIRLSIVFILLAVAQFITMNNSRRKYYISNYITGIAYSCFAFYLAAYVYRYSVQFKEQFLTTVDFTNWKMWVEMLPNLPYTESTFWFDAGVAVAALGIVSSLLNLANIAWKTINMIREKKAVDAFKLHGNGAEL